MNREQLYDAVTEVDGALIDEAAAPVPKKRRRYVRWMGAIAAVVALAIVLGIVLRPGGGTLTAYALATPVYPEQAPYPDYSALYDDLPKLSDEELEALEQSLHEAESAWFSSRQQRMEARKNYTADDLRAYLTAAIPAFLGSQDGENAACSPLNLYLALAMLAETAGGESRAQLLALLGVQDMDRLRTLANSLFLANYSDDGATKSLLAGALWLRDDMSYNEDTVKRLAETYYCASFRGVMGSEDYDRLLRDWLNENTGNLLEDQLGVLSFDRRTVLALTTTVDFAAKWSAEFQAERTDDGVFHARSGDLPCRMMHQDENGLYYWGEHFAAADLYFREGGRMRLILPDEGVTPEELLSDPEALSFLLASGYDAWENCKGLIIHLSLPKFDVSSQLSLETALQGLGVTDVFTAGKADFSPITDFEGAYLSQVTHGARVLVDEEGVRAAAYTAMIYAGSAAPPDEEVDLTLDRPFVFAIYGTDNLPLFVGIVNTP